MACHKTDGGITTQDISLAQRGQVRQDVRQRSRLRITNCCVRTLTIRTDAEVEQALKSLTRDGQSRSEATRAAILAAERMHRRALLRAEAEQLRNDPDDVPASRELAAEMDAIRAR
jgi:ABC-type phosphate/phosphonate transport system ATPase subunit